MPDVEPRGENTDSPLSRTLCVTEKVFLVSRGTVQLMGSGERMSSCSGDFTRVGSGGDLTTWATVTSPARCRVLATPTSPGRSDSPAPGSSLCGCRWRRAAWTRPCWPPCCCPWTQHASPPPACPSPRSLGVAAPGIYTLGVCLGLAN